MTTQQQALCENNMRLVSHCVQRFTSSGIPWDELCASGNLGLVQAAATFLPERNPCFSTYACRCINNEVYKLLRQRKKHSKVTESLDDEISGTEGMRFHDVLPDDTDIEEMAEVRFLATDIMARIEQLPSRQRTVCQLRYGLAGGPPMNQREIAERLGCSRSLICRRLNEGLTKIKSEVQ